MNEIKIGNKTIGEDHPIFIIAEAGVNHNGSLELAKKLIDAAVEARADAIKFQTFSTEKLIIKEAPKAEYQKKTTGTEESQYQMLKKLELNEEQHKALMDYANQRGIIFLSTPYDKQSVELLERLNVPSYKIASCDITNIPLIKEIAKKNKPIILSTGMANLEEIEEAINVIKKYHNKLILLHCTTEYPTKLEDVNLRAMTTLKEKFDLLTGYSDHTVGILVPLAAVSLGACLIEKHITLDKNLLGPDHNASISPIELNKLIYSIRKIEKALGSSEKKATEIEQINKLTMRRSLYANRDIKDGEVITKDMIGIKRPEIGLKPKYLPFIIGKKINKNLLKGQPIKKESFEGEL